MHCWFVTFLFELAWLVVFIGVIVLTGSVFWGIIWCADKIRWRYLPTGNILANVLTGLVIASFIVLIIGSTMHIHTNICSKGFKTTWTEAWK